MAFLFFVTREMPRKARQHTFLPRKEPIERWNLVNLAKFSFPLPYRQKIHYSVVGRCVNAGNFRSQDY